MLGARGGLLRKCCQHGLPGTWILRCSAFRTPLTQLIKRLLPMRLARSGGIHGSGVGKDGRWATCVRLRHTG